MNRHHGMLLALSLHEFTSGSQSAAEAKALRETGGWNVKLSLYVDAMSVYAAVLATFIKIPAENCSRISNTLGDFLRQKSWKHWSGLTLVIW